jgi:hypothetical protein
MIRASASRRTVAVSVQPCEPGDQPGDDQDEPHPDEPRTDEPPPDAGKGGKPLTESVLRRSQEALYRKRLALALKLMPKVTGAERETLDPEDVDYRLATEPGWSCADGMPDADSRRCDLGFPADSDHVRNRWLARVRGADPDGRDVRPDVA